MRGGMSRVAICAVAAIFAGCGDSKPRVGGRDRRRAPKVIQPGAPGEPSRKVVACRRRRRPVGAPTADVAFMQGMIHHHQQAVMMADWVPDRTQSTSLRLMARRMAVSQQDEMDADAQLARRSAGSTPTTTRTATARCPGMVNSRQLRSSRTRAARRSTGCSCAT